MVSNPTLHTRLCLLNWYFLFYSGYIGEFEIIDDHRSNKIVLQLNGRLNKTGVISPRFNIQHTQIESWVNLLLPARGFGIIILVRISIFAYESLLSSSHLLWLDHFFRNPWPWRSSSEECGRKTFGLCILNDALHAEYLIYDMLS